MIRKNQNFCDQIFQVVFVSGESLHRQFFTILFLLFSLHDHGFPTITNLLHFFKY